MKKIDELIKYAIEFGSIIVCNTEKDVDEVYQRALRLNVLSSLLGIRKMKDVYFKIKFKGEINGRKYESRANPF